MMLPPSGNGRPPVRSDHHSPRSTIFSQPFVLIRQLTFVDQQTSFGASVQNGLPDLVEGHDNVFEVGLVESQRQVGGRQGARDGDAGAFDLGRTTRAGDDDGPVLVAHAGAVRQQRVLVDQVRVGVERDRCDFVTALERGAVQGLDIREDLVHDDPAGVDVAARQPDRT